MFIDGLFCIVASFFILWTIPDFQTDVSLFTRRDTFIQAPWSESRSYAREKIVGHNACTLCRSPVFLCPASGYSCPCCLDNDAGWCYQNVIIYGGLLVLGSLVLDVIARYLAGFGQNCINQMMLRYIYQFLHVLGWFSCATVAPISPWLDSICQEVLVPIKDNEHAVVNLKYPLIGTQVNHKSVQTIGPANKKIKKQALALEKTRLEANKERKAKIKGTAKMLNRFKNKWQLYTEERLTTDEMISTTERNIQYTEQDNILQEEVCRSLREQLQSQRDMNKATICTYEKIHMYVRRCLATKIQAGIQTDTVEASAS